MSDSQYSGSEREKNTFPEPWLLHHNPNLSQKIPRKTFANIYDKAVYGYVCMYGLSFITVQEIYLWSL